MKKFKAVIMKLAKDESGQGATEYVLLVVVVVALVTLFRQQIYGALQGKLAELSEKIGSFQGDQ